MRLTTQAILILVLSLCGCGQLPPDEEAFTHDVFRQWSCEGVAAADEAASLLKSNPPTDRLVVEVNDITAGPSGRVVTIVSGEKANTATEVILVFADGSDETTLYATKAGEPTPDDLALVNAVIQGARLRNCTHKTE